jgi:hypothetical protein
MVTNPLRVAAQAARAPERTLRRWQDIGALMPRGNDVWTTGTGNHCGWSRNRILQAAITQALVEKHVAVKTAANFALKFTDEGQTGRAAAHLFQRGKTVLLLGSDDAEVANVDFSTSIFDLANGSVTICIDLNRIVEQVDNVLSN